LTEDLKSQRDRYIAFSLAAADLLIEVDEDFRIVKTVGATQALLNQFAAEVIGGDVADIFTQSERPFARRLLQRAREAGRIEPCALDLDQGDQAPLRVNLGACHLPGHGGHSFLSLTVLSDAARVEVEGRDEASGLLETEAYKAFTQKALRRGGPGAPEDMKLVRVRGLSRAVRDLPDQKAQMLVGEIGAVLRANALNGVAAARLSEEDFSYLPSSAGAAASSQGLSQDITAAARAVGLPDDVLNTTVLNLALSVGKLDPDSIARALTYVLSSFSLADRAPVRDLESGLQAAMAETVSHFDSLRTLIDGGDYTLFYQPVVRLDDRSTHHYEALLRFSDGRAPFDTIRMSEQLGLVQEFDLAVARKAVDMLNLRSDVSIAINLSGQSAQNDAFREALRTLLMPFPHLSSRLLFELTESKAIEDMEAAANFLRWLRRTGYQVCLDDFGAGAATYAYLRRFDVDYVKIDGPFIKEACENQRQRALIRSIAVLAHELNAKTVAEMIEDETTLKLCEELGIDYGQGFLFGKPKAQIDMPKPVVNARRRGFSESWG
jgi:EAL domain-containing protein (putative c-di-GMP-specific phosphodiesterase class I)